MQRQTKQIKILFQTIKYSTLKCQQQYVNSLKIKVRSKFKPIFLNSANRTRRRKNKMRDHFYILRLIIKYRWWTGWISRYVLIIYSWCVDEICLWMVSIRKQWSTRWDCLLCLYRSLILMLFVFSSIINICNPYTIEMGSY